MWLSAAVDAATAAVDAAKAAVDAATVAVDAAVDSEIYIYNSYKDQALWWKVEKHAPCSI